MSAFWSMFWFKPFRNFLRKFTIFRNFDQWSEILSMSDGRPSSQGVCPSLLIATLVTLTRGIQGCPKTISFDKSTWHPTFVKSLQSSFSLPLGTRTFSQHPLPKNALPSSSVINPRILFPFFLSLQFFTLPS